MKVNDVKNEARQEISELYDDHPELQSVYFQGSITFADTEADFDPETSDIDTVAIVPDHLPIEKEGFFREQLEQRSRYEMGIRFLYPKDLNDGARKSRLATFVDPKALLYAFPDWEHVAGHDFDAEEFDLWPVKHEDVIDTHMRPITHPEDNPDGDWRDARAVSRTNFKYYLNNLSRLIDAVQNNRNDLHKPFSYSGLQQYAEGFEEDVVRALLDVRRVRKDQGMDAAYERYQQHADLFQNYIAAILDGRDITKATSEIMSRAADTETNSITTT